MNLVQIPPSIDDRGTTANAGASTVAAARSERRVTHTELVEGTVTEPALQGPLSASKTQREGRDTAVMEEYFECYVEAMDDHELRLRTISSRGEEAIATMPIASVPEGERRHLEIGVPIRIAIFVETVGKQVRRQQQIRVLRSSQWKLPLSDRAREELTQYYERRLHSLLHAGG